LQYKDIFIFANLNKRYVSGLVAPTVVDVNGTILGCDPVYSGRSLAHVSEERTASIFRVEHVIKQVTGRKKATLKAIVGGL
jgi:hypothetical protein